MVTQPMQGGSASAVASAPDEEYIRQLQEAITSGQLNAEPLDDGSWRIMSGGFAPTMQGGTATATAAPPSQDLIGNAPPPADTYQRPYTPPPERQVTYEDGSSSSFKPTDYAISPETYIGLTNVSFPDTVAASAGQRGQLERMDARIQSKETNKETLRQLGLDDTLADLTPYAAGPGGTISPYFQPGYVGTGTDYASIPVYGTGDANNKNLNKQVAFHEGVIHPIEGLLTPEEQAVIYDLRAQNPDPFFMQLGEPDPRKREDPNKYHILTGYFDAPLGAGSLDVNPAVVDYIKQLTPLLKERAKAMASGAKNTTPPVIPVTVEVTPGEPQASMTELQKFRYQLTGEQDIEVQQLLFNGITGLAWEDRQRLFTLYKQGITPRGTSFDDPWGQKLTGLGLDRQGAWDRMVNLASELGGNATVAQWEQWADKAALTVIDPVTEAGKAILGEEAWNALPGEVHTLASWAPILLAPETGLFKKIPILGGAGLKTGAAITGGALAGYEVSKYTGAPELPSELIGGAGLVLITGKWERAILKGVVDDALEGAETAATTATREQTIADMKRAMPGLEEAEYDRLYAQTAEFRISEGEASRLNATYEGVRDAAPNDMVTVFHATSGENAEAIARDGFNPGGALTSDPETAKLHALNNRMADPVLVAFQVPRKMLGTKEWFFTAKSRLTPVANEIIDGWIPNAQATVRNFLSSEEGSLNFSKMLGGGEEAVPEDVARLAFSGADEGDLIRGMANSSRINAAREDIIRAGFGETEFGRYTIVKGKEGQIGVRRGGEYSITPMSLDDAAELISKSINSNLNDVEQVITDYGVEAMSDERLRRQYAKVKRDAFSYQDQLDILPDHPELVSSAGLESDLYTTKERLYQALHWSQVYGEELATRTAGKEGMVPYIKRAIGQFITEEEGSIRLPKLPSPSSPNQVVTVKPATNTTAIIGNMEIIPRRTRADNIADVLKSTANWATGQPLFLKHNPLGDALTKAYTLALKGPIESRANMATAWSQYLMRPKVWGRVDKETGRLLDIAGGPTVQDLAAKLPNYWPMLNAKQQYAMKSLKDIMEPYYKALTEQGLDIHDRRDIIDGGFYLPRGAADTPGAQFINEGPVVYATGRNVKKSFEKTARFDSMVDAIEMPADATTYELIHGSAPTAAQLTQFAKDFKGFRYYDFPSVMEKFFRDAGTRVLDAHMANVLLKATDDAGVPLWSTPESRMLRDPKNAAIKGEVDLLRKQVKSLVTSLDKMDVRVHRVLLDFLYSPAPDLSALKDALDAMSTKGGTLKVGGLSYASTRKQAIKDMQQQFKDLRSEVYSEVFTNRGKYAGINPSTGKKWTLEQARKDAAVNKYQDLHIGNGTFKGVTFEQGKQFLDALKTRLQSAEVNWKKARDIARLGDETGKVVSGGQVQTRLQNTRFGALTQMGSNVHSFDEALAGTINKYLQGIDKSHYTDVLRSVNDFIRGLRSTGDISFTGVQGTLGLGSQKNSYRHAWAGAIRAMVDPIDGRYILGKFIDDFNQKALAKGLPSASEWMTNGIRMGGIDTEFMLGGKRGLGHIIGGLPGIHQANRGFGYFGDIFRLDGAQKQFELKGGLNALPSQRTALMREIAYSQNLMTGWSPGRTLGQFGDLVTFAPRFLQSQIETIAKAANLTNWSVSNNAARSQLLNLMGQGAALTAAANVLLDEEDFNWWDIRDSQGHLNPNFMKIRALGKDWSLFGPWDSLLRAAYTATVEGDPLYLARTKASPLVSTAWDLMTGRTFMGDASPDPFKAAKDISAELTSWVKGTDHDFNANNEWGILGDYAIRSLLPLSWAKPVADLASGKTDLKSAATDAAVGVTGFKASDLSNSEKRIQLVNEVTSAAIADGMIPPELVETFKRTDYFDLSSAEKKLIDREITKRHPDMDAAWKEARRQDANVYQIVSDEADSIRARWKPTFDDQLRMLMAGDDPAAVWEAYDDQRNQMAGAFKQLYDGGLKESKGYQDAVSMLRPNDIRAIEAAWNSIISSNEKGHSGIFDWDKIEIQKQEFIADLIQVDPAMADRFVATLRLNDQFNLEDAHPMTVLKKIASTSLKDYYAIEDADPGKQADKRQEWLSQNPDADFNRFITADYDSGLNSVAGTALAIQTVPNRKVHITNTTLEITPQNLPTLQKYDKQIMQLITMPTSAVKDGRAYSPRTELRKNDVLYDALYFWLGFSKGDDDNTAVVYHLSAVNEYLKQWGPRSDGVKPRQAR